MHDQSGKLHVYDQYHKTEIKFDQSGIPEYPAPGAAQAPRNVSAADDAREVWLSWGGTSNFYFIQRQIEGSTTWEDIGWRGDGVTKYVDASPVSDKPTSYRVGAAASAAPQPGAIQWSDKSNVVTHHRP